MIRKSNRNSKTDASLKNGNPFLYEKRESGSRPVWYRASAFAMALLTLKGAVGMAGAFSGDLPNSVGNVSDQSKEVTLYQAAQHAPQLIQLRGGSRTFTETIAQGTTLSQFLGTLNCTGCHRNCPLLAPSCQIGAGQREQATSYYNEAMASANTETSDSGSSSSEGTSDSSSSDQSSESNSNTSNNSQTIQPVQTTLPEATMAPDQSNSGMETDCTMATSSAASTINIETTDDDLVDKFGGYAPYAGVVVVGAFIAIKFIKKH